MSSESLCLAARITPSQAAQASAFQCVPGWTSRFIGRDCHKTAASASGPSIRLTGDSDSDSDDPDTLRSPDRLRSRATPGPVQSRLESLAVKV